MTGAAGVRIEPLTRRPVFVPVVARWLYNQWWHTSNGCTPLIVEAWLRDQDEDRLPLTLVAEAGGEPVGTVSLFARDLETHHHLSPWLSALYVEPAYRRQGMGAILVQALEELATDFGVDRLHLFTELEDYYTRLGWQTFEILPDHPTRTVVMTRDL